VTLQLQWIHRPVRFNKKHSIEPHNERKEERNFCKAVFPVLIASPFKVVIDLLTQLDEGWALISNRQKLAHFNISLALKLD